MCPSKFKIRKRRTVEIAPWLTTGQDLSSQHPSWAVHDHLQLQFQGIWSPLCTCKAYAHVCAWANTDTQILNAILIFKKGSGLMLDWLRAKAMSYHVGGSVPGTQGLCFSCWHYPWWLELLVPCYEWMHIINCWQHCVSQGNAGSSTQERDTWALQGQWLCSGA